MLKRLLKITAALALLYVLISAALFAAMFQSPDNFAHTMKHVPWPLMMVLPFQPLWDIARHGWLHPGQPAPDFDLETTDHRSHFQLSSLRGQKPVVLVFGSYT
jgi:hypothetical protein